MKNSRDQKRFLHAVGMAGALLVFLAALIPMLIAQSPYRLALPGYHYSFPHDYFNHPDFATEWWYYTGNLQAADGHRFGFELTFFRQAVTRNSTEQTAWDLGDV